ncbi:hypothetical protein D9M72_493020 [compost metagenome]
MTEEARHQCGRGGTVDVVIAEGHDLFTPLDGHCQAIGGPAAISERIGIRHQRPQRRIEEARRVVKHDTAAGKHATEQIGIAVDLADGERPVLAGLIKPRHPALTADRLLDAEKGPLYRIHQFFHARPPACA